MYKSYNYYSANENGTSLILAIWEFTEKMKKNVEPISNLKAANKQKYSVGSSVSQNKLPQLILGYIYILKYLQSNFIG